MYSANGLCPGQCVDVIKDPNTYNSAYFEIQFLKVFSQGYVVFCSLLTFSVRLTSISWGGSGNTTAPVPSNTGTSTSTSTGNPGKGNGAAAGSNWRQVAGVAGLSFGFGLVGVLITML